MSGSKIGEHLRDARESAGLSSGDAAKKIGVSLMSLSRYENDHRLPDAEVLISMSKSYGCDLADLMVGKKVKLQAKKIPVRGKILDRTKFTLNMQDPPSGHLPILLDDDNAFAVEVSGTGLQPMYYDGDFLIVTSSEEKPSIGFPIPGQQSEIFLSNPLGKIIGIFRKR